MKTEKKHFVYFIRLRKIRFAAKTNLGPEVSRGEKAGERITNKHQFVCCHNETLSSGDKDAGRLVPLHAAEQHVDGVCQAGEVGEALRGVKGQQLRVLQGERHRQRRGWCQLFNKRGNVYL